MVSRCLFLFSIRSFTFRVNTPIGSSQTLSYSYVPSRSGTTLPRIGNNIVPGDTFRCVLIQHSHMFAMQAKKVTVACAAACMRSTDILPPQHHPSKPAHKIGAWSVLGIGPPWDPKMGPLEGGGRFYYVLHTFRMRSVTFWGGPHKSWFLQAASGR